ncbi:MAG TPA: ABC transporter ATP-binding protein [Spirochaetota bacterium]|nr:ABC transporter ATP-binding protein [Spirochaetota bacterium]
MLKITGIKKTYDRFSLDIGLMEVAPASHYVLLGPTGSGKTLLMNLVAGLIRPDSGSIEHRGVDITGMSPEERGFGIVYQDSALFPHLDVAGNIGFGLRMKGVRGRELSRSVESIMEDLGINHLLGRRIDGLSGGEKQRVAIARALILRPALIMLDEPFSSLDYMTRQGMMDFIRRIRAEYGPTFFHITHDLDEAMSLADRVAVIRDGRIVQEGLMREIFHSPGDVFVANFTGMRNIYRGRFSGAGNDTVFRTEPGVDIFIGRDPGQSEGYVMVRADDIILAKNPVESSATNCLPGVVTEILPKRGINEVSVDIGCPMYAYITARSVHEMALKKGDRVYVVFKATSVHML